MEAFKIRTRVWIYESASTHSSNAAAMKGAWHFLTIPKTQSDIIKKRFGSLTRGWGSLPVVVKIGRTSWKTSIFPDKQVGAYLLPLKADVRKKEKIANGDNISFELTIIL